MCISDAKSNKSEVFFRKSEGELVEGVDEIKILGFKFTDKPNLAAQVASTKQHFI